MDTQALADAICARLLDQLNQRFDTIDTQFNAIDTQLDAIETQCRVYGVD